MSFATEILKIPLGSIVQTFELERQELIYNEYGEQGRGKEYDYQQGLLQVLR